MLTNLTEEKAPEYSEEKAAIDIGNVFVARTVE